MSQAAASLFDLSHLATDVPQGAEVSPQCNTAVCGTAPTHGVRLTDEQREAAIKRAGDLMLKRHAVYAATGCLAALGDAHRALEMQRQLIAGRSAEQIARMEQERGLA